MPKLRLAELLGLLGLTVLGAGLRAITLNTQLWCDEIVTLVNSVEVPFSKLITSFFYDNQHTLYSILAQVSVEVFGEHPWTVRLPAMVMGTASIPAVYLLARAMTSRGEALAAAGLLAVSYHHIWFSQNARGYTILLLTTLLATWLLLQGLRGTTWRPWLLYAATVALGAYTHLTMVFLAFSHALICGWLLVRPGKSGLPIADWRKPAAAFVVAGGLSLALYAPMLGEMARFFRHSSPLQGVSTPLWALSEAWSALTTGLGGLRGIAQLALGAGMVLVLCGLVSYYRESRVVFALFILPIAVTFLGALAGRGTMYPRFFFFLLGFGLLVVVRGLAVVLAWSAQRVVPSMARSTAALATAVVVLLLMGFSAASLRHNYSLPKQDFEGALEYVLAHCEQGDPVVTAGVPATFCYEKYYRQPWQKVESVEQLAAARAGGRPVWLVYAAPRFVDKDLLAAIKEQFAEVRPFHGTLQGGEVVVCRALPSGPRERTP